MRSGILTVFAAMTLLAYYSPAHATKIGQARALCKRNPKCKTMGDGPGGAQFCVGKIKQLNSGKRCLGKEVTCESEKDGGECYAFIKSGGKRKLGSVVVEPILRGALRKVPKLPEAGLFGGNTVLRSGGCPRPAHLPRPRRPPVRR